MDHGRWVRAHHRLVPQLRVLSTSPDSAPKQDSVKRRKIALVIVAIAVAGTGSIVAAYAFHLFGAGTTSCNAHISQPGSAHFTIVMANQGLNVGFNGSRYHSLPWPIMNVTMGQTFSIHVMNNDTTQSHGFAITRYFDRGITLGPGQCYDLTLTADQSGAFTVYCNIFCTIHINMQSGRLNVN